MKEFRGNWLMLYYYNFYKSVGKVLIIVMYNDLGCKIDVWKVNVL